MAVPKGLVKVEPRRIYAQFNYSACPAVARISFRTAKEIERRYGGCAVPIRQLL
jgi:epoxyqueuosine reductase